MRLGYHPAPGLSELLPGWYNLPQNPIRDAGKAVTYTRGIAEILPAAYSIPQNPIKDYVTGNVKPLGTQGVGCGCGCGGSGACGGQLNGVRLSGMGDLTADWAKVQADWAAGQYGNILTDTVFGIPVWAFAAGLALVMFAGGEKHSYYGRGRRAARAARSAF